MGDRHAMDFSALGLAPNLLENISKAGYETPTPIQCEAIPQVLAKRDVLALAQTGTGKSAAFTLPILQQLDRHPIPKRARRWVRTLVLTPTRELTQQVAETFRQLSAGMRIRVAVIVGGVSSKRQIAELDAGVDVVVATPGRLLDLLGQRQLDLRDVEVCVLDEADQMLDMGFLPDIRKIIRLLPEEKQSLMFSATMPQEIGRLADDLLRRPVKIRLAPQGTSADNIQQSVYHVEGAEKSATLTELLTTRPPGPTLVFVGTRRGVDMVTRRLGKAGIPVGALHGDKSQSVRQKTLARFKAGEIDTLVATDIAARGIDIASIELVVNFDLPAEPETYIHRIGRTARAGASGEAISFCAPHERHRLKRIERHLKKQIPAVNS